jgi:hypothetical protein
MEHTFADGTAHRLDVILEDGEFVLALAPTVTVVASEVRGAETPDGPECGAGS